MARFRFMVGKRRFRITGLILSITILIVYILNCLIFPLPIDKLHRPSSTFVYSRDHQLLRCFLSSDGFWRKPVKLNEISPLLRKSVIEREDKWFYYHPGVNPVSLAFALFDNVRAGRIVRGASTITMQIARMMEPKERTLKSKLIEILRAIQLEMHYSKDELLEIYFNLAPYGGNIEGVGAASYFYFGKSARELTASQAATLTSIPNSPTILRPDINPENCIAKRDRVLRTMLDGGIIDKARYAEALIENISNDRWVPPFLAPHFTQDLASTHQGEPDIVSTIDLKIQNICEGILKSDLEDLKARGIFNASIVVLDNLNMEILTLVGSADFLDIRHQGQVNGATASRSPGSALKPFVYAMALDDGMLSPNSLLNDLPVYYSGYSPENFDKQYRGVVTATDALRQSLNVPAVELCSRVGQRRFYNLLKAGGITTLNRKYYEYGLPIILGSCEVSLLELTNLYSSFANDGLYRRYRAARDELPTDTTRIASRETSYIISEILSELKRPDFPSCWEFSPDIPKVSWKTGTSYGRKDAWSIGYNPRYSVGVWVGNFDGQPSPHLVGAEAAAPILFRIFEALSDRDDPGWFERPNRVRERMVCAVSGMRPGENCPSTVNELYIPGVSPESRCDIHKGFLIDDSTGYRLCKFCEHGKHVKTVTYEDWDPKIATWLKKTGGSLTAIPSHNPDCTGAPGGDRPVIISPNEDIAYVYRDHIPVHQQGILLEASVTSDSKEIYWFVDGLLYGKIHPGGKLFLIPERGKHRLTCTDDHGRSSSIEIEIL